MSILQIMSGTGEPRVMRRTRAAGEITRELAAIDVRFARWRLRHSAGSTDDEVLAAYREDVEPFRAAGGFRAVEVVRMAPDDSDPAWESRAAASRATYLNEHVHEEDEVWFFVDGCSGFFLHAGDTVHVLVCEAGDLLSIPAGTRHWFDMGPRPDFRAFRFYKTEEGFVADFTGDPIPDRFPRLENLLAVSS